MAELTVEERREKALRTFMAQYEREEEAIAAWEDYCRKSGLLASEDAGKKKAAKKPKDR